jgi:hypothetical protein
MFNIVGYGDYVPSTGMSKIFMILAVLVGIWLLSILVASIHNEIQLNEDEEQAYRSINRRYDGPGDYLRTAVKHCLLKRAIKKEGSLINSSHKVNQFFHNKNNYEVFKGLFLNRKSFQDIFNEFKNYSYFNEKLFSFIENLNDFNKKSFDILDILDKKVHSTKLDCQRSRNLSYSIVNMAKALSIYPTIGKVLGI